MDCVLLFHRSPTIPKFAVRRTIPDRFSVEMDTSVRAVLGLGVPKRGTYASTMESRRGKRTRGAVVLRAAHKFVFNK